MALTQTFIYRGAFTITFNGGGSKAYTGVRKDNLVFGLETKEDVEEIVDGADLTTVGGRKLIIEVNIDELVPADLDTIETYDTSVTILFGEMGATEDTITIAAPKVIASIDGMKSKIRIIKSGASDSTIAALFSIG